MTRPLTDEQYRVADRLIDGECVHVERASLPVIVRPDCQPMPETGAQADGDDSGDGPRDPAGCVASALLSAAATALAANWIAVGGQLYGRVWSLTIALTVLATAAVVHAALRRR